MMNYEMFKEMAVKQFLSHMPDNFQDYQVKVTSVTKVNATLDGLNLIPPEHKEKFVCPTIYLNDMYQEYLQKGNLEETLELAAFSLAGNYRQMPDRIRNLDFSNREENIMMQLIHTEQNKELLERVSHRKFQDLSIIYRYILESNSQEMQSILIDDSMAGFLGMTEPQFYEAALETTQKRFPPVVKNMQEILREVFEENGMPKELADLMIGEMSKEESMYVITNSSQRNGAVSMVYEEPLRELAEQIGTDLYLLPSSIHEVIVVSASIGRPEDLAQMVAEINGSQVPLEERLSNQVYHYDKELRKLTMATDTVNKRLDGAVPELEEKKKSR